MSSVKNFYFFLCLREILCKILFKFIDVNYYNRPELIDLVHFKKSQKGSIQQKIFYLEHNKVVFYNNFFILLLVSGTENFVCHHQQIPSEKSFLKINSLSFVAHLFQQEVCIIIFTHPHSLTLAELFYPTLLYRQTPATPQTWKKDWKNSLIKPQEF